MPVEFNTGKQMVVCCKCGMGFSKRQGNFRAYHGGICMGTGHLPICNSCYDKMFVGYLKDCGDPKMAMHQLCRALDIYWNEDYYDKCVTQNGDKNINTKYLQKVNTFNASGKTYDDTLAEHGMLWKIDQHWTPDVFAGVETVKEDVPEEVRAFWGSGYSPKEYYELEQRRSYWMSHYPDDVPIDIGTEALIRQICNLEIDINRQRIEGKTIDKSVNSLNTLLGSLNLKPAQNTNDATTTDAKTPFGVWIKKWEDSRPVPEPDPELEDVDNVAKYIDTWYRGHLAKMLNIKNAYSRLYEDEIAKMRVERPEYDGDDDETLFYEVFKDGGEADE